MKKFLALLLLLVIPAPAWADTVVFPPVNYPIATSNLSAGCSTYTPTDASGASLTITVVQANYCTLAAKVIWVSVVVTYPTNASGAVAQLTLPVANDATSHNRFTTTFSLAMANGLTAEGDTGGNCIFLNSVSSSGGNANATLSTATIGFAGIYHTI
jgi:hypothetical protein